MYYESVSGIETVQKPYMDAAKCVAAVATSVDH